MDFLRRYFRSRLEVLAVFLLFAGIFAVTFWLGRLPVRAVLYPALICAVFGAAALAADLYAQWKKHLALARLREVPAAELPELPEPASPAEADLQEIVDALRRENAEVLRAAEEKYRDTVDYYTVWAHQIKTPITSMRLTLERGDTPETRKLTGDLREIERYVEMVMAYLRWVPRRATTSSGSTSLTRSSGSAWADTPPSLSTGA